jgi:hypothetical protein
VGPRARLDVREKPGPHRDSIPGPSSPQSVAIPTELPGPQVPIGVILISHLSFPRFLLFVTADSFL